MTLSSIALTEPASGKRLATAEITQDGETVSLPRISTEEYGNAAPDTFTVVATPTPIPDYGFLVVIWGVNGTERQIYMPRMEVQQIGAATEDTLVNFRFGQIVTGVPYGLLYEYDDSPLYTPGIYVKQSQVLSPQAVQPDGPQTATGVLENQTTVVDATYGGGGIVMADADGGGLRRDFFAAGGPDNGLRNEVMAQRSMRLSSDSSGADFRTVVFDFSATGQHPSIYNRGEGALALWVSGDMNGAQVQVRVHLIEHGGA